jgi:hypothetical protein
MWELGGKTIHESEKRTARDIEGEGEKCRDLEGGRGKVEGE